MELGRQSIESTLNSAQRCWRLGRTSISLVLLLIGGFLIQPRLTERRIRIDDQFILTPSEVAALPSETLVVVLDREDGQDQNDFKYKLL